MQKTSKKFSIITPVYNRADCIIRCMNSVTRQNGEIEHWIVDDGSTDGTLQVIQEYASLHSHIKIVHHDTNKGVNAARNSAIQKCNGKYILFLDSDDELKEAAIQKIDETIVADPHFLHYLFLIDREAKKDLPPHLLQPTVITYQDWLLEKISGDFLHVMNREMLQNFPFNEQVRIYEIVGFLQLYQYSQKQLFIPEILVHIEQNRKDSVSLQYKLTTKKAICRESIALKEIIHLCYTDYVKAGAIKEISRIIKKYKMLALATEDYTCLKDVPYPPVTNIMKIVNKARLGKILCLTIIGYSKLKSLLRI